MHMKETKDLPQHMQQLIDSDQYKAFAKKIYEHNEMFSLSVVGLIIHYP